MKTAIIGAGMVGLALGRRLAEQGDQVIIYERNAVPGGLAASFKPFPDGDNLERYYHHIFSTDTAIIEMIGELGLQEKLKWHAGKTSCFSSNQIYPFDSPSTILSFPLLSFIDRLRLALALGILKIAPSAKVFEKQLAVAWFRKLAGNKAYETIFAPLFKAKFSHFAESISLAWFWARIHDRSQKLGYLDGGFAQIYEALVSRITMHGGSVRLSSPVKLIAINEQTETQSARMSIETDDGVELFDRVIATIPVHRIKHLFPAFPTDFSDRYSEHDRLAARCVILALNKSFMESYWLNICDDDFPFMVAVEHTRLIPPNRYGGKHLLYLGNYAVSFENESTEDTVKKFVPYLRMINPNFDESWIDESWKFSVEDAQPICNNFPIETISPRIKPRYRISTSPICFRFIRMTVGKTTRLLLLMIFLKRVSRSLGLYAYILHFPLSITICRDIL